MTRGRVSGDLDRTDVGDARTPYRCSFHWFRLPDDRICGLDVIRSDDTGQLSLRAFVVEPDGEIRGLAYAAPCDQWQPFTTTTRPQLDGDTPGLGRGADWVAGQLTTRGQGIDQIRFDLNVSPRSRPHSTDALWELDFVHLAATDIMRVQTTGWVEIDGRRFEIDSDGTVSLHFGQHLPLYGYMVTVARAAQPEAPRLLLSAVSGGDIRVFGKALKEVTFTYAYGDHGVPSRMYAVGHVQNNRVPLTVPMGHVQLSNIKPFPHLLLGVPTITASADAIVHHPPCDPVDLGRIVLDYRGAMFTNTLTP
ncbi:MAG: hypothetical protein K0V04_21725 [Deltaproteobacteria bacterium]|nr:hypothetical protein [Deltaproteobacteria bacterium]